MTSHKMKHHDEELFKIGDLAEELGITLRTIRFYEDAGLIKPARSGQCRLYTRRDRGRLHLICRGKRLGFSIAEIREFIDLYNVDTTQKEQMHFLLQRAQLRIGALKIQLQDVTQTLHELQKIETEILDHLQTQDN